MILLKFLWSVIILPTYCKHRLRSFRPPWKRVKNFRRHRLHYSLFKRCLRRSGQILCRLNGSLFPSPCFIKRHRWRRRNTKARARHKRRRTRTPESVFFTKLLNYNFSHPHLIQDVSGATLEFFCDGSQYFLSFPRLMFKFKNMDHAQNVQRLCQRLAVLSDRLFENRTFNDYTSINPKSLILICDIGSSLELTPFRSDFIDYVESDTTVKDVTKINRVIGIGTTLHKFKNDKCKDVFLPCVSYHLPTIDVRIFSPQTYHQMHGGKSYL